MNSQAVAAGAVLLAFAALIFYNLRAFSFCRSILLMNAFHPMTQPASLLCNCLLLAAIFYLQPPMLLVFFMIYLAVFLQLCMIFRAKALTLLFGSGNFMFHLMNVQMVVSALFVLIFRISSAEEFFGYYPSIVFLSLLLVTTFLEAFRQSMDQEALRLLLQNNGQLFFATSSMTLINIYLLVLSVSYGARAYSPLSATFLLCTGVLLFGAFYTSFQHALRMSLLLEYQNKSRALESQLEQSYEHLAAVEADAATDALTKVHSRRYGLDALSRQLEAGKPGCACFLDVDRLKEVNDKYGHEEGDLYLLRVVQALSDTVLSPHTLARLGGDEFLLLLPDLCQAEAQALLERVQSQLLLTASRYTSSVSYGILELGPQSRLTVSEVLRRADNRMYEQKARHHGRKTDG